MKWKNELTTILKTRYPIVQAPMLGVTTPLMVAEISETGGLGSLPVGGLPAQKTIELIHKTKELTHKPFAVNLFVHEPEYADNKQVTAMQAFLENLCRVNNLPYQKTPIESYNNYSYKEQVEILLSENIPVVSFTFGILDDDSIQALKRNGVILIGAATCIKEAKLLDEKGIDVITAQGIEAGGHRASFIPAEPLPEVGSITLIPQVVRNVNRPVLAAGGINDGRTIKAALTLGAKGVQIGTAFICSKESAAIPSYKSALLNSAETDTVLTRSFSGRWARGLRNKFITEVEASGLEIPGYPVQLNLISSIRAYAQQHDNKEFAALWAGQGAATAEIKPVASIFKRMIEEAEAI